VVGHRLAPHGHREEVRDPAEVLLRQVPIP